MPNVKKTELVKSGAVGTNEQEVKQALLLAILSGVFSMKTTGNGVAEKLANTEINFRK